MEQNQNQQKHKINFFSKVSGEFPVQENRPEEQIKELLFSGGAGCIGFMMGYLHGLIEIVGKDHLKQYKLGGVSAGNAAALFFHMCLYQDKYDMKFFHETETCKYFSKKNKKFLGLFTNYQVINENTFSYTNLLEEFKEQIPNINGKYHCVVTEWEGGLKFKKVVLDEFQDEAELSSAIQSSCQIPILSAPKIFNNHKGRYFMDGGLKGCIPYKYENSQKIYLNMLPGYTTKYAELKKKTKNLKSLNITEGYNIQFPRDYYVWSEEWNNNMFLKGYLSATENKEQILETFGLKQVQKLKNYTQNLDLNEFEDNNDFINNDLSTDNSNKNNENNTDFQSINSGQIQINNQINKNEDFNNKNNNEILSQNNSQIQSESKKILNVDKVKESIKINYLDQNLEQIKQQIQF